MPHTVQNTLAMAIGKFNFASLKEASEFAAWIFFAFSSKKFISIYSMASKPINIRWIRTGSMPY